MREKYKKVLALDNIEKYENIVIAGPCWWGTYPIAVFSQIDQLNFEGKKVYAVMTHEGSGLGSSEADLKKYCKGARFGESIAVHGGSVASVRKMVEDWAKRVNLGG